MLRKHLKDPYETPPRRQVRLKHADPKWIVENLSENQNRSPGQDHEPARGLEFGVALLELLEPLSEVLVPLVQLGLLLPLLQEVGLRALGVLPVGGHVLPHRLEAKKTRLESAKPGSKGC